MDWPALHAALACMVCGLMLSPDDMGGFSDEFHRTGGLLDRLPGFRMVECSVSPGRGALSHGDVAAACRSGLAAAVFKSRCSLALCRRSSAAVRSIHSPRSRHLIA